MNRRATEIHRLAEEAIAAGTPLEGREIRQLRERHGRAARLFKLAFWVALAVLNVALWVPLPVPVPTAARTTLAVLSVLFAFSVPVWGMRRHQRALFLLEQVKDGPAARPATARARAYLEAVREQGRPLVRAEVERLEA